mgnify:CR=1 FL=1
MPSASRRLRLAPSRSRRSPRCPRIVAIGGGTGLPIVLRGLADALADALGRDHHGRCSDALTAIVTVSDDGGSSGRLRRDLGMLPPGDIRNCLAALAANPALGRLLDYRFDGPTDLEGHSIGNLMLAAMAHVTEVCQRRRRAGSAVRRAGPCVSGDRGRRVAARRNDQWRDRRG